MLPKKYSVALLGKIIQKNPNKQTIPLSPQNMLTAWLQSCRFKISASLPPEEVGTGALQDLTEEAGL